MRVLLDANVLLDCLVLETSGAPRPGKSGSERVLTLCDLAIHDGLVAWHSLPIVAYYHGRQHAAQETGATLDELLTMLAVTTVTHAAAAEWRVHGVADFEDALQIASAVAGGAAVIITRNTEDFTGSRVPVMTPEEFLAAFP